MGAPSNVVAGISSRTCDEGNPPSTSGRGPVPLPTPTLQQLVQAGGP
jgi:hypothetical protein